MKKNRSKSVIYWIVIGLPVSSILMGIVTFYMAAQVDDRSIDIDAQPISKTSWNERS